LPDVRVTESKEDGDGEGLCSVGHAVGSLTAGGSDLKGVRTGLECQTRVGAEDVAINRSSQSVSHGGAHLGARLLHVANGAAFGADKGFAGNFAAWAELREGCGVVLLRIGGSG
jgi:hypothetical protein